MICVVAVAAVVPVMFEGFVCVEVSESHDCYHTLP